MQNTDNVNNPKHYAGTCSLECIDIMEVILGEEAVKHFCLGNAFKYLWRYKNKNGEEDLKKAEWYLNYVGKDIDNSDRNFETYHKVTELYKKVSKDFYTV
jgi:hypothetical protein|nr:MAG TPA: nucelotide kinase [Caudoviricetes sp.]